jgi:co-chaperonin GroES (HSP10)
VIFRPLRGRVIVQPDERVSRTLIVIDTRDPRSDPSIARTHRGTVLAVGPGTFTRKGVVVEAGVSVGDVVQYHFEAHEEGRTFSWGEWDRVLCLAQREIDAIVE